MRASDFDFELPAALIAQEPLADRSGSRLLCLDMKHQQWRDSRIQDLPDLLCAGDLLVFNDTQVIKARLFGQKASGGQVEVLVERILPNQCVLACVRASHAPRVGSRLRLSGSLDVEVLERHEGLFKLRFLHTAPVLELLAQYGQLPLPPYIRHAPTEQDMERYQTVYACHPGAVAAPTAGLHFDPALLTRLTSAGVGQAFLTLHVGAGTFQPIRTEQIAGHKMHHEWFCLPDETVQAMITTRARGGRIIAVGTTVLRAIESAWRSGRLQAGSSETDIFITPGYQFRGVDGLLTNFHLPRTTLLLLVAAMAGRELILRAYHHAMAEQYRFFSYGDAMLLLPDGIACRNTGN